jgi:hypothetical protein
MDRISISLLGDTFRIQFRHGDVQNHDIGFSFLRFGDCLAPGMSLIADLPLGPRLDQGFDPPANQIVIIGNQNS